MRSHHPKKKTKGESGIGTATLRSAAAAASNALRLQLPKLYCACQRPRQRATSKRNGMKGGTCVHAVLLVLGCFFISSYILAVHEGEKRAVKTNTMPYLHKHLVSCITH